MNHEQFQDLVIADLSQLKLQMRQLLGNGQPGRLHDLEARVARHEAFLQRATGLGWIVGPVLALLHVGFDYVRLRWSR
jgi:hypothetical protein